MEKINKQSREIEELKEFAENLKKITPEQRKLFKSMIEDLIKIQKLRGVKNENKKN